MTATLIDGRAVAQRITDEVAAGVAELVEEHGHSPALCTILVGDDPASATYVAGKERACLAVGMRSLHRKLPADASEADLLDLVRLAATDVGKHAADGILVQLPLPDRIDPRSVLEAIPASRDVDGIHARNMGALVTGQVGLLPCTAVGIMRLLDEYDVTTRGADVVVVGNSLIVGTPVSLMLLQRDATVTVAHEHTRDLADLTRRADILISATGVPGLISTEMIKPGATVIDVGIVRTPEGLRGDVVPEAVDVAGLLTPVPGGVGPMTVAMLLANTLQAARWRCGLDRAPALAGIGAG